MSTAAAKPKRIPTRNRKPAADGSLSALELDKLDAYWRALNYLSVECRLSGSRHCHLFQTPVMA